MHLTRLALTDFRSYAGVDLSLEPGVSTLLGANGQGKTNLVEAAAYVATLGSHRVATDAPLVRSGAERAILRAAVTSGARDSLVEIEINPGRANRARLNRAPVTRPRQVLGVLRTVLFARFTSRQDESPAMKVVAALRNQFGGHAVTASGTDPDTAQAHPAR